MENRINKIVILGVVSLLYSSFLFADAPYEKYHVAYENISKDVLKNTIGILTINSGVKKGTELKTYSRIGKQFIYNTTLRIKETIPVSNFGYHPPIEELNIENYRYPIVAKFGEYLCIVYDPIKNSKTWINIEELEKNFYTSIVMLDNIETPSSFFVDIFYFTKNGRRRLYKEPKKNADFIIISKDKYGDSLLSIIAQKNEFVKIGVVTVNFDTYEESIKPLGWIRIRDDKGMLRLWIKYVDLC